MQWRFIPKTQSDPLLGIALEETLLNEVSREGIPIIRFWEWGNKTVTIGRSQKADNEVDLKLCDERNINVIRRPSGGGAMYHAPKDELVYSIIVPRHHFPDDITQIYRMICEEITEILNNMDIQAKFVEPNSIFVDDYKISGSSQRFTNNVVLQHGTILYTPNRDEMFSVLREKNLSERHIGSNISPVTGISELLDISFHELYKNLKQGFLNDREYSTKDITNSEIEKAQKLLDKKYKKEDWNLNP